MKSKSLKSDAWNFVYQNFCGEWLNGIPLGNGDLGALMVPHHKQTTFALAKSDVWDERCDDGTGQRRSYQMVEKFDEMRQSIEAGKWDEIEQLHQERERKWNGKFRLLPAGLLVLNTARFEKEIEVLEFGYQLDMQRALGSAAARTRVRQQTMESFVSVEHQVLAVRVRHKADWRKGDPPRPMTFGMDVSLTVRPNDPKARIETGITKGVLWKRVRGWHEVDYTMALTVSGTGVRVTHDAAMGRFTVTAPKKADFTIYLAIVSEKDGAAALLRSASLSEKTTKTRFAEALQQQEAIRRARGASKVGFDKIKKAHVRGWSKFWSASRVDIPDRDILRQYHFGLYLLGASSRHGFPMPGLQGLWTTTPTGSGWNDYSNDLNIQMNYWPVYTANHLELTWPYYDTVRGWLPERRRFTRDYFGCRGVQFPPCISQAEGISTAGYLPTNHWAGHAAFVAQNFWTHWLYSRDEQFLRDVAHPFLKECALFYLDFLKKDARGLYIIWPSSMPEAGEGSYEAWGKNPTMDIALLRMLFGSIVESARVLGCDAEFAAQCRERLDHLPAYPIRNGHLIDMESKEFLYSHRHPGMLTPIYPCADISGKLAEKSVDRFIEKGKWLWCGFSPVWVAAASARVGRGEAARNLLREFMEVYTSRAGGFNLNYDYAGTGLGMSGAKCFTNETNSGFSAALLEMLLQSHNGLIRVFPALPKDWKDVSFQNLRAEGAFLVSATRMNGRATQITIRSERGGVVRVKSPWLRQILSLEMKPGQCIQLHPK